MWLWGEISFLDCIVTYFPVANHKETSKHLWPMLFCDVPVFFFVVVDPFCGLHSLLISAAKGVWEIPKISLENYFSYCSFLLSFSICFPHCSLVSKKLWLVKFSQAHLIYKYLPLRSSFIIKLPIISTVRSSIITKHMRENGNARKNISRQKKWHFLVILPNG